MSQIEKEIADLYQKLGENLKNSSKVDKETVKLLRKKVKELGNDKLIAELSKNGFEVYESDDDSDEESLANTGQARKSELHKFELDFSSMGPILSRFLPSFKIVYHKEVNYE